MIVAALAVLAALAFIPITLSVSAALTLQGGAVAIVIRFLGFPVTISVRVRILGAPPCSADILRKNGTVRKRVFFQKNDGRPAFSRLLTEALRRGRVRAQWFIGVEDDPALTVMLCGAAGSVTQEAAYILLPNADIRVSVQPVFTIDACRMEFSCITSLKIADIIKEIWIIRGE